MAEIARPPVHRVAWIQLMVLSVVSIPMLFIGWKVAATAVLGGLIQIIPHAWFTHQAWRYTGARQTRNVVSAMYRGESGKLLLTAVLFTVVFYRMPWVDPAVLFISFGVMILVQLFSTVKLLNGAR